MIKTIIGYHLTDSQKRLYNWKVDEYSKYQYEDALEKGELYAIAPTRNLFNDKKDEIKIIKVIGFGEVVEDCNIKKVFKLVEMNLEDANI